MRNQQTKKAHTDVRASLFAGSPSWTHFATF
jgi:hypothetical protein